MKVVFVSNMLNHHSMPLCKAFVEICDDFKFVSMVDSAGEGYQITKNADFVIKAYKPEEKEMAEKYVLDADFVIFGANSSELLKKRMQQNKISFLYSERLFKKGFWQKYVPRTRRKLSENIFSYNDKPLYALCASGYLPQDLVSMGFSGDKIYKWGYFPEIGKTDFESLMSKKETGSEIRIIWVGRLIKLKHPEFIIRLASKLKNAGYDFCIDVVGDGPLRNKLENLSKKCGVEKIVSFLGTKTTEQVRECMDKSDILLFTSDFNEGWGAVLNEGMDSGCACVASHAAGATSFLIKHGENGLIFKSGDFNSFYKCVKGLLDNMGRISDLSENAFFTMRNAWNADEAAKRLTALYKCLAAGKQTPFDDGPCSKAEVLKHNWYKLK